MSNDEATLRINNQIVEFSKGENILDAARHAKIYIPTLCYVKGLIENQNRVKIILKRLESIKKRKKVENEKVLVKWNLKDLMREYYKTRNWD